MYPVDKVAILVHYQPSYKTSHTKKQSDPLMLADVSLHCGMYLAGKVDISQHLAIPGFPQSDHTVGKLSVDAGSLWNTVKQASRSQVILKTQPPIWLDYRARNRPQL